MKALVVLSGGLDSTVALAEALKQNGWDPSEIGAVTFTYGQKHTKEIDAAKEIVQYYGMLKHHIIDLPQIFGGTDSVLVASNELEMPESSYEDMDDSEVGVSPTYVPYRNGNFLSVATTLALVEGADEVWAGMHSEDAYNWAYPDCTPEFLGAMANAMYVGSYHKVRLITPHMWRTKAEVVLSGRNLDVPFGLTWSCYNGEEHACGVCPTCVGRIQAFQLNNLIDPVEYQIDIIWAGQQ